MDKVLTFEDESSFVGNTVEFMFFDKRHTKQALNIGCSNPWAGSTETGFGADASTSISKEQIKELIVWLREYFPDCFEENK